MKGVKHLSRPLSWSTNAHRLAHRFREEYCLGAGSEASRGGALRSVPWRATPVDLQRHRRQAADGLLIACAATAIAAAGLAASPGRPTRAEEDAEAVGHPAEATQGAGVGGRRVFVWGHRNVFPTVSSSSSTPDVDIKTPTEVAWFREHAERSGRTWKQLAFGPSFGVARTADGELFVWGSCCKGKDKKCRTFIEPQALHFSEADSEARFRDVQCSESAVWALTEKGEIIVWERVLDLIFERSERSEDRLKGGKRLPSLDDPVRQMSIGPQHAVFLTEKGDVYCLGNNRCGECGTDPSRQTVVPTCRLIQFPRHVNPVAQVRCGRSHTVIIGHEGQCMAWGDDSKIQLGLGDTRSNTGDERPWEGSRGYLNFLATGESMAPPPALRGGGMGKARASGAAKYGEFEAHLQWRPSFMIDIPLEFARQAHGTPYPSPTFVECGDDFTIMRARDSPDWYPDEEESDRLFCCGDNGRGQCGRSLQASQQMFSAVKLPRNCYTLSLSCGASHCVAVVRRVGHNNNAVEVWSWGSNDKGQAGNFSSGVVCPARKLKLPSDALVQAVCCGFSASAAICVDAK